ncbi:MAG: YbhB/YbcL family Raf kinase inhibitor-like protein [Spirochaetales bacterium]|nr:YbhB/YbcL family Raf kinase inhibitor-like protein [Spirochaetales bacterium]
MTLTSSAFTDSARIPSRYTCDGDDVNPPLSVADVPSGAKSLALIVDDPDAPAGTWVHWVVYDIPVISRIGENSVPGKQGRNNLGKLDYGGPCPPAGTHRYYFRLYALDFSPDKREGLTKKELMNVMSGHILGKAELMGVYSRR